GPGQPLQLSVSHPSYVGENVDFLDVATGGYNNPVVVRSQGPTGVTLTIRLGRIATAPTKMLDDASITALAVGYGDPKAALLFHPRGPNDPLFAYRFQWNASLVVRLAEEWLLPSSTPADNASGWDRFQNHPSGPVSLMTAGRFFWVLYPE